MRAWTVDADDIRVAEDFDESLLHRTPEIDDFLTRDRDDKFIVIGTKGFGKTLLLKAKRVVYQREGRASCLPPDALLDKPIGDKIFSKEALAFLSVSALPWSKLWLTAIAVTILKHRKVSGLFTTPKLLEALGEKIDLWEAGIRGVFCGGTSMSPQYVRFLIEEVLENRIGFYPTYGNTLMGLAASVPLTAEDKFSITYYAPQPRAALRVVDPKATDKVVDYGQWGRVELTTLTKEFFMPGFLERDEGEREPPYERYPWDGVSGVRPFHGFASTTTVGVY